MIADIVLIVSLVILLCIISEKFSDKLGIPALIFFMFVGMLFGEEGIFKISYENYSSAEIICSIALIFIMFDGGFNTNWKSAKQYISKSLSLSTLGVVLTALIATLCIHLFLSLSWMESFLISAVLASTDAASVFAILKRNNLDLKDGTSSILEVESGSNDPMAYLLTITAIGLMSTGNAGNLFLKIFLQLSIGTLSAFLFARISKRILSRQSIVTQGLDAIYVFSIAMLCYAVTDKLGGNAYLSVYILGLYLGNSRIRSKRAIISFFNELTSLLQYLIFFVIGLLSTPSDMPSSIPMASVIIFIMTFIARPLMTIILLMPQKCSLRQCLLISWAGIRGASSVVFAIVAVSSGIKLCFDLFHVIFVVSLFSIMVQGALLPKVSEKLEMIIDEPNVYKTFNDYEDSAEFQLARIAVEEGNTWIGKKIKDISFPYGSQVIMVKRNGKTFAGRGKTLIKENDDLIINVPSYHPKENEKIIELQIDRNHPWCDKKVEDLHIPADQLIILLLRNEEKIIPIGSTLIQKDDVLLIFEGEINSSAY